MQKSRESSASPVSLGAYYLLWGLLLFCGFNFVGFQLLVGQGEGLFISWQKLPLPPVPVRNLLPSAGYVRIVGINDVIYRKAVVSEEAMSEPWFIDELDIPDDSEPYTPTCTADDLPFSLSPTHLSAIQMCNTFYVNIHSPSSYVVMDESRQLWVWVNRGGAGLAGMAVICITALFASPILSWVIVKRIYR